MQSRAVALYTESACNRASIAHADPEEVGLGAREALEWPQHVDLGNLPEGAQWRFADPQDSAAAQVTRLALETVLRHVATMCGTASSMLGMEAEIALRIVSGHTPAHFCLRQCSSCLAFRLPHMLCFVTLYLKLRIHAIERFHNT